MWRSFLTWRPWFWGELLVTLLITATFPWLGIWRCWWKQLQGVIREHRGGGGYELVIAVGKRASTRCSSYSMAVKKPIGRRTHTRATWLHGAASELSMYSRSVRYMKGTANKKITGPHSWSCFYNIWVGSKNVQFWQVSEWHQIRDLGAIV